MVWRRQRRRPGARARVQVQARGCRTKTRVAVAVVRAIRLREAWLREAGLREAAGWWTDLLSSPDCVDLFVLAGGSWGGGGGVAPLGTCPSDQDRGGCRNGERGGGGVCNKEEGGGKLCNRTVTTSINEADEELYPGRAPLDPAEQPKNDRGAATKLKNTQNFSDQVLQGFEPLYGYLAMVMHLIKQIKNSLMQVV